MDVISSINNAISLAQRLREISKNIEDAEFKNVLADLSHEIADTKLALAVMTEENANLKNELTTLRNSKGQSSNMKFEEFAYFESNGDGPFCPGCYDSSGTIIRLSKLSGAFTAFGSHTCPSCKEKYGEAT